MAVSKKHPRPRIERIEWVDSMKTSGWLSAEEATKEAATCQSVGFVAHETEKSVTLALNHCEPEDANPWGDIITIPKVAITKRKPVKW